MPIPDAAPSPITNSSGALHGYNNNLTLPPISQLNTAAAAHGSPSDAGLHAHPHPSPLPPSNTFYNRDRQNELQLSPIGVGVGPSTHESNTAAHAQTSHPIVPPTNAAMATNGMSGVGGPPTSNKRPPPPPLDTMRAYRACLNCRGRKSKCDLDINQGRPVCFNVLLSA